MVATPCVEEVAQGVAPTKTAVGRLSKLRKARLSILCDDIFLVRLHGEIRNWRFNSSFFAAKLASANAAAQIRSKDRVLEACLDWTNTTIHVKMLLFWFPLGGVRIFYRTKIMTYTLAKSVEKKGRKARLNFSKYRFASDERTFKYC